MKIKKFTEILNEQKDVSDKEYERIFRDMMKKYGIKSPNELEPSQRKEFFDQIDKLVLSDKEKKAGKDVD